SQERSNNSDHTEILSVLLYNEQRHERGCVALYSVDDMILLAEVAETGSFTWIYRAGDGEDPETGSHKWFLHGVFG
ncbi:hypothetical protein, partial [Mesorhizobium sp. M1405]